VLSAVHAVETKQMLVDEHIATIVVFKSTGKEAIASILDEGAPELVIIDINTLTDNGVSFTNEFTRLPTEKTAQTRILFVTAKRMRHILAKPSNHPNVIGFEELPLSKAVLTTVLSPIQNS
jgi:DNA-binding NarL/FixJ family response regulator